MIRIKLAAGITFLVLIMLAVACGAPQQEISTPGAPSTQNTPDETQKLPADTPSGTEGGAGDNGGGQDMPEPAPTRDQLPERVPQQTPPITGEAPEDILSPIFADVAERTGAKPAEIEMVRSQSVTWNDGAIGCPQQGMVYTQALVDGYWVVLSYQGQEFDYRVNDRGAFFLCEKLTLPGAGSPGGNSPDNPAR